MSNFLENLKDAADNGEFNSEAAKKLIEINELAETKAGSIKTKADIETLKEKIENVSDNSAVTEEEALELNSQYEKEMEKNKERDIINTQIATLVDIEDMVKLSISDMFEFIGTLNSKFKDKLDEARTKYSDEFGKENEEYIELARNIETIEMKYSKLINDIKQLKKRKLWQTLKKRLMN
ncbi:MAG: hypothetical protein PF487_04935 [Bacteroidales bacterium]|jgi:hypothetical protein|nr:hypothetical protein [Bacteroidales bacterium]